MANLFKEFKTGKVPNLTSTGVYAISGEIAKIDPDDDTIKVTYKEYNRDAKQVQANKVEVSLAEVGGVEGLKAGDKITMMCEKSSDGDYVAKRMDVGNAYLMYKGYGVCAGECYFRERDNAKTGGKDIIASIRVNDKDTERMIKNNFVISGYQGDTKPQDTVRKHLEVQVKKNEIEQASYADVAYEGVPFDSVITFKENPTINEKTGKRFDDVSEFTPEEGKNAGTVYYSRQLYAQALTTEMVGEPMMDLINEKAARRAERAEHASENTATAERTEENEGGFMNIPEGVQEDIPVYGE